MQTLPIEYLGSVCEVKTIDNEMVAAGTIRAVTPEFIDVVDRSGSTPSAPYGMDVKISVFNSRQGFRVMVGKVYTSSMQFVRISDVKSVLDYERRHFFRVETRMFGYIIPARVGNAVVQEYSPPGRAIDELSPQWSITARRAAERRAEKTAQEQRKLELAHGMNVTDEPLNFEISKDELARIALKGAPRGASVWIPESSDIRVVVENLSLGGALVETDQGFKLGSTFNLRLKLGRYLCTFRCEVRRITRLKNGNDMYGCAFLGATELQNNVLCSYIFQRQREQIGRKE